MKVRRSRGDGVNGRKAGEGASDPKLLEANGSEGGSDIGRWAKEAATTRSWPPTGADASAASSSGPSTCWCRAPPHPAPAPARATSASGPCTRRCRLPLRPVHLLAPAPSTDEERKGREGERERGSD